VIAGPAGDFEHLDLQQGKSRNGTFDNPAVRQAFLKVVPREQILRKLVTPVRPDAQLRSSHLFLPASPDYERAIAQNGSERYADVDVPGARKLLAEAGVSKPTVCILFDSSNPRRRTEFTLVRTSAARAGFVVTDCSSPDWANLLGVPGAYDASLFAWSESNSSTTGSRAVYGTHGARNYNFYSNAEVDALLRELAVTTEQEHRTELRQRIDHELWRDGYGVPLYQFPQIVASNGRVAGLAPSPRAAGILWNLWEWKPVKPR
jgi:peptide/nickel transport system substrate-binding protein